MWHSTNDLLSAYITLRSVRLCSSYGKGGLIADLKHRVTLWTALKPSFGVNIM
jgi:hypothetical protein